MDIFNLFFLHLVQTYGLVAIFLLVFAEASFFIGVILPGDSLLVLAGVYAANGKMNLTAVITLVMIGAILGDNTGYWIGRKIGQALFGKEKGILFNRNHLIKTQQFFDKYGPVSVFLGRYIGYVRTFLPSVAGIGRMEYRRFVIFEALGAISWTFVLIIPSYIAGKTLPNATEIANLFISGVIIFSLTVACISGIGAAIEGWRRKKKKEQSVVPDKSVL